MYGVWHKTEYRSGMDFEKSVFFNIENSAFDIS